MPQQSNPSRAQATSSLESRHQEQARGESYLSQSRSDLSANKATERPLVGAASSSHQPPGVRRLNSLVRNTISDSPNRQSADQLDGNRNLVGEEQRKRIVAAEFHDDDDDDLIRSHPSASRAQSNYQAQHPSTQSVSLISLKEQDLCCHQLQQATKTNKTTHSEAHRLIARKDCTCNSPDCRCFDCATSSRHHRGRISEKMSSAMQTSKLIPAYFIAELLGTFMLIVIGDGTIGAYVLTKRQVDIFCTCFGFGVGAMIATFVSGKISGAHLNPAATVAFALDGRLKWKLVPVYVFAQYLGGFLAALVLFLNYHEAIGSLDGGARSAFGATNSTGGIFATYPAPYVTVMGSLMDQIVGTAVLLFSLSAISDKRNRALEESHQPLIVAFVIGLTCVAFSPNCGAIFNPARDLAPRLVTYIFGYPSVWQPLEGTYWLLAGVLGPHIGAVIGVFGYKYLIGTALSAYERHEQLVLQLDEGTKRALSYQEASEKAQARLSGMQQQRQHELGDYGSAR